MNKEELVAQLLADVHQFDANTATPPLHRLAIKYAALAAERMSSATGWSNLRDCDDTLNLLVGSMQLAAFLEISCGMRGYLTPWHDESGNTFTEQVVLIMAEALAADEIGDVSLWLANHTAAWILAGTPPPVAYKWRVTMEGLDKEFLSACDNVVDAICQASRDSGLSIGNVKEVHRV